MPLGSFRLNGLARKLAPSFAPVVATGGTVSDITVNGVAYRTHRFTSTGNSTFTVSAGGAVDILLVGGGSSGLRGSCCGYGCGGGAGGVLRRHFDIPVTAQNYTITVGNGGAVSSTTNVSFAGQSSSGLEFVASGGRSTRSVSTARSGFERAGRDNDDFTGGVHSSSSSVGGAGGAGAGGTSITVNNNTPRPGGPGASDSEFSSSSTFYGGGGGGGGGSGSQGANGGSGGGGKGGSASQPAGQFGVLNTGGGGGGGASFVNGGAGGSGIVIIRYPI